MSNNTVALVIPYYNDLSRIERCLNSIVNQTIQPDEVVIIDDFSDDSSELREFLNEFTSLNISYVRNESNKGAAYSRNKGVQISKSDFIGFLDADDFLLKEHIESNLDYIIKTDAQFVYSDFYRMTTDGSTALVNVIPHYKFEKIADFLLCSPPQTNSFFIRRAIFEHVRFDENLRRHQDYQFIIDALVSGLSVKYSQVPTTVFCDSHRPFNSRFNAFSVCEFWDRYHLYASQKEFYKFIWTILFLNERYGKKSTRSLLVSFDFFKEKLSAIDFILVKFETLSINRFYIYLRYAISKFNKTLKSRGF